MVNRRYMFISALLAGAFMHAATPTEDILPNIHINQDMEGILTALQEEKQVQQPTRKKRKRKGKQAQAAAVETPSQKIFDEAIEKMLRESTHEQPDIELNFENADLQNVVDYIEELFHISFITDDAVKPIVQGGKGVSGNKITFRTERLMSKREVWSLYTTFLDMAGLAVAIAPQQGVFRITASLNANKMPLPIYIGTSIDDLPDNENKIRYVYFLANASIDNVRPIIDQMRSTTSTFNAFVPLRAIILTDKAYNIKALMKIIHELDKASLPETVSVVKLRYASSEDVKKLFDELTKSDDQRGMVARIFGAKKQTESFFFPENTRMVAEPRTNSLVLFGTQDTIKKIESFIERVDKQLTDDVSPLYIYELQYTDASSMAEILNKVTQYGIGTVVGQAGGVRDGEKYFKPITFTPEKSGNRLIVKGDYEDYLKAKDIIEQLDVPQPQVALEVLVVDVEIDKSKALGMQWRNPGNQNTSNVAVQSSGLIRSDVGSPPVVDPVTGSIMANLIGLATGNEPGSTLLSLGPTGNVWAMFKALSTKVETRIVSNPFLVATNKYKSTVSLGSTRRVVVGTVVSGGNTIPSMDNLSANLEVTMIPQINSDGIVQLELTIKDDTFTDPNDNASDNGNTTTKLVQTKAAIAQGQVLAIGGLIRTQVNEQVYKVPILGDIPILGTLFFRNQEKDTIKQNLLIFIAPQIIRPKIGGGITHYTMNKADYSRRTLKAFDDSAAKHDPIHRWFFRTDDTSNNTAELDDFMNRRHHAEHEDISKDPYYPNRTTREKPKTYREEKNKTTKVAEQPEQQPTTMLATPDTATKPPLQKTRRSLTAMLDKKAGG